MVEAAAFVTDAEEANIYLAEPGTDELVFRASKNPESRQASLQRLRVTDTLVGEVFRTGQALLHQPSLEGGPVKVQTGFMVQSLVEVPLAPAPRSSVFWRCTTAFLTAGSRSIIRSSFRRWPIGPA